MRSPNDPRKDLGQPVRWTCKVCGRVINAHTTTYRLATLQHLRKHMREEAVSGKCQAPALTSPGRAVS